MSQTRSIHEPQGHQGRQIEDATRLLRDTLMNAVLQASLGDSSGQPALQVARAAATTVPSQMAAEQSAADAATRQQIAAWYEQCLANYRARNVADWVMYRDIWMGKVAIR